MNRVLHFCLLFLALGVVSCKDDPTAPPSTDDINTSVITNVMNSFTYSLNANQYSANEQSVLSFSSDSLTLTLTALQYVSGTAVITVKDSLNAVIFADTVRSNRTTTIAGLKTSLPKHCGVVVTGLSGKLVFVVVGM